MKEDLRQEKIEQKSEQKKEVKFKENEHANKIRGYQKAVIGLTIATSLLGASTIGFGIAYGVTQNQANTYSMQLENVYQRNYYELVDSVNNADMKISKLLASNSREYQGKMLTEISQASKEMQSNIATLPLSGDNVMQSVRFINQMAGYTQVLEEKLAKGDTLSEADKETLSDMHDSLTEMKKYLNKMSENMWNGYSILGASSQMNGEFDDFTLEFAQIKADDTDYPTMIYDGPFSDSVVNQKIKGLSGAEISKEDAYKKIDGLFKNISNLQYQGETDGRFSTFNYSLMNSEGQNIFVQTTKIGGHILTVSGNVESNIKNIDFAQAEKIALDFAKSNGVENAKVVWSEELNSQAYFNIAPVQNNIILYPDLVKVKVDLEHGDVIGYDAISYFTNHAARSLGAAGISVDVAKANIDSSFEIKKERLVLAPLDYNREILCFEFEATRDGATYYIYFNAATGQEENILKVVETTDGSKLM
ncbi:MAG: germination protein YpeB [Clostridia bacterium]|nr:germination protein YpeB [Clostridia bacterium]